MEITESQIIFKSPLKWSNFLAPYIPFPLRPVPTQVENYKDCNGYGASERDRTSDKRILLVD